ncbi:hypothetical protein [Nocardia panacis]|uniref:hypothetical protein n=1 Tax=Nocardia panacis TaxID=2340916 RepID=UPI00131543E4|nr:hypothetical protein [Nocardia panacis]
MTKLAELADLETEMGMAEFPLGREVLADAAPALLAAIERQLTGAVRSQKFQSIIGTGA